jgi:hypothetical protein
MQWRSSLFHSAVGILLLSFAVQPGTKAQEPERITIQANAVGTGTQLGKLFPTKIIINQVSSPEDQQALLEGFKRSGHQGMLKALTNMKPKGRIALEGRVGNDVKYIRELPSTNGRRFRLVTDRNLAFGELYENTRSRDYDIGGAEVVVTPDGKGTGTLLPACKLKLNKKKELEIETYQNPWKLDHFIVTKGD